MAKVKTLQGLNRNVVVQLKQIHFDPLIQLKKYDGTHTGIGPGLDKNGFPETGLTEDYKSASSGNPVKGTRKAMEEMLDLAEGTLKQTSDYWHKFFVRVGSDPIELDLSSPHDLLKFLFCKAQTNVADGLSEISDNSKHEFVLYSEEQEAATRVQGRQSLKKAYALSENLDQETKINILAVYGEIADATSPNAITDKIDEYIEEDPDKFLQIAEDENLVMKSLVTKCLDKGVLIMKEGAIYHGEVMVGHDKESAAGALSKDKKLTTIMKAKLSGDMDLIKEALSTEIKE